MKQQSKTYSSVTEAQEYEQQTEAIDAQNAPVWNVFNVVFGIIAAWGAISLFGAIMLKLAGGY